MIEDCAQAHGARIGEKSAGNFGTCGAWSFYPTKNLGAIGDGGAITTGSANIAEAARSLRNYGQSVRYHHPKLGMNSRLDELQAAILRERLRYLDEWTIRRRQIAQAYMSGIENKTIRVMPLPSEPERHVHHLFVVNVERRDELQAYLKKHNVDSLIHYPIPIHLQEPCREIGRDSRGLAGAEAHARSCLSLPCHPAMSQQDVDQVITALNQFGA